MSKKPFHVMLTEAERARLEAIRARQGQRSQADVIRYWIAREPIDADQFAAAREASGQRRKKEPKA